MGDLPDDLTLRTVTFDNDIDQIGVVMVDPREEQVEVSFDGGRTTEWLPRNRLEDVTESYDCAYRWGLTDESHEDED